MKILWRSRIALLILTMLLLILGTSTVTHLLAVADVPNLLIILVVIIGLSDPTPVGAILVFFIGLIQDCSTATLTIGSWSLVNLFVFLSVLLSGWDLDRLSFISQVILVTVISILSEYLYSFITLRTETSHWMAVQDVAIRAALVGLISPIFIWLCKTSSQKSLT